MFRRSVLAASALCAAAVSFGAPAAARAQLLPPPGGTPAPAPLLPQPPETPPSLRVFEGNAMWIWVLASSSGGSPDRIAARARRTGIELVILKGAEGTALWRQVSPALVRALHARGLRVCAYQFIHGRRPRAEARTGARLARRVDCLLLDAETTYEGRYVSAQTYLRALRRRIGQGYPVGLTSFPYVHYHPAFPYSVFLGAGGAQFNVPQMYWRAIGTRVDRIFRLTYRHNRVYGRAIFPLGQVYDHPPPREIRRFRAQAAARGATGVSWWSWQAAGGRDFRALRSPFTPLAAPPADDGWPMLGRRSRGDLVVWAQQHLLAAGKPLRVTGTMTRATRVALRQFQRERRLPVTGVVDAATWPVLLAGGPAPVRWRRRGGAVAAGVAARSTPEPASARLPALRDELSGRAGR
ncbi:MAG: peptidoglycan-binding domain-containing protein [Thermoleophilaceae bacterium]